MTETEVLFEIQQLLRKHGNDKIGLDTDLVKEDVLDSIEIIDFMVAVEKKFNIKLSQQEFVSRELNKVRNLTTFLIRT